MKKKPICSCGCDNFLIKADTLACAHCGLFYFLDDGKNNDVKILYIAARCARNADDNKLAAKYYSKLLIKDPKNWEAVFYAAFCEAMNCTIERIERESIKFSNCFKSVVPLIAAKSKVKDRDAILDEIYMRVFEAVTMLDHGITKYYNHSNERIILEHKMAVAEPYYKFGAEIESQLGTNEPYRMYIIQAYEQFILILRSHGLSAAWNKELINELTDKINHLEKL